MKKVVLAKEVLLFIFGLFIYSCTQDDFIEQEYDARSLSKRSMNRTEYPEGSQVIKAGTCSGTSLGGHFTVEVSWNEGSTTVPPFATLRGSAESIDIDDITYISVDPIWLGSGIVGDIYYMYGDSVECEDENGNIKKEYQQINGSDSFNLSPDLEYL